jgi:hypothetical protein
MLARWNTAAAATTQRVAFTPLLACAHKQPRRGMATRRKRLHFRDKRRDDFEASLTWEEKGFLQHERMRIREQAWAFQDAVQIERAVADALVADGTLAADWRDAEAAEAAAAVAPHRSPRQASKPPYRPGSFAWKGEY